MKVRNKKTGEVVEGGFILTFYDGIAGTPKKSLAELNEEWEDVPEESKEYWYLDSCGDILRDHIDGGWVDKYRKQIGNFFGTEEEANRAVEKLKTFRRLKDKGFRFDYVGAYEFLCGNGFEVPIRAAMPPEFYEDDEVKQDLIALFGGEE